MNSAQRFVFLIGVMTIAYMGVYPPWKEAGARGLPVSYGAIYAPPVPQNPENGLEIDFARLFLQFAVAAILTGGLITATSTQTGKEPSAESPGATVIKESSRDDGDGNESEGDDEPEILEASFKDSNNLISYNLPKGDSIAEFLVEADDDPDSWEWFADASGNVRLPSDRPVQLEVVKKDNVDLSFLSMLKEDTLHSVDLTNCRFKDWELSNLSKLTGLKELDLTGTNITNQAIGYFDSLGNLEKLWLDGTAVDDESIESLNKFNNLKKLSIRKTKISKDGLDKLKASLKSCKVEA